MHDHHDDCGCSDESQDSPNCVATFVSHNDNYKAAVYELSSELSKYEVAVYEWKEVNEESPVWERVAGPIIMDTQAAAETWGQQNLAVYAGEKLDDTVEEGLRQEVFGILGHEEFDFLSPHGFETTFLESEDSEEFLPIPQVDKVLVVGSFYFAEFKNTWLAGFLYDQGQIRCWKKYDDLKTALIEVT